jgi:glycosyltransferase involved in cell wall biosynthesis
MPKLVIIAQTPPPFHGQAIMQQFLVNASWSWCDKQHIRLDYSDSIQEVGKFSFSKITKLLTLLKQIRLVSRNSVIDILYYPPAGPNRIPLYRDIITLLYARRKAKKIVLHFHAGGLNELISQLSLPERWLAKKAFSKVAQAVVLSPWLEKETHWFLPQKLSVVPNGIEDTNTNPTNINNTHGKKHTILFVGNLKKEKGIVTLLKAATVLKKKLSCFSIRVMGEAHSEEMLDEIRQIIRKGGLEESVVLLGGKTGEEKWKEFRQAGIFCLPTYATEAMPVSILEAMMYALPVVSTNWRAIPDIVENGVEGLLHPVKDEQALAEQLIKLLENPALQEQMGKAGRKKYESRYTITNHLKQMEQVLKTM